MVQNHFDVLVYQYVFLNVYLFLKNKYFAFILHI